MSSPLPSTLAHKRCVPPTAPLQTGETTNECSCWRPSGNDANLCPSRELKKTKCTRLRVFNDTTVHTTLNLVCLQDCTRVRSPTSTKHVAPACDVASNRAAGVCNARVLTHTRRRSRVCATLVEGADFKIQIDDVRLMWRTLTTRTVRVVKACPAHPPRKSQRTTSCAQLPPYCKYFGRFYLTNQDPRFILPS